MGTRWNAIFRGSGISSDGQNIDIDGNLLVRGGIIGGLGRGKVIFVDPANGADTKNGRTPRTAVATPAAGYAKLTANMNDVLVLIGDNSGAVIADQLIWAKNYTHFIGISSGTPIANRARIFNSGNSTSTNALLKVTATGCRFENLYLFQGSATAACGCIEVNAGERNYFKNVHAAGMGHATASAGINSYSLKLDNAHECIFDDCTFGLTTIKRTGAGTNQAQIVFDNLASRNQFLGGRIINYSDTAAHVLIKELANDAMADLTIFDNMLFYNMYTNHGGTLTELMDANVGATHDSIFINPAMIGIDEIDAGDVASVTVVGPATAAGCGIGATPTT